MNTQANSIMIMGAFNEAATIEKVISDVKPYVSEIVVINDGSADETEKVAHLAGATVISHMTNLGQGAALQTGIEFVRKYRPSATAVVTYDADGQFTASDVPLLIHALGKNKYDVILGSRFLGKTINMPHSRKLVLKLGIWFTKFFSNISLTDTHNGFRVLGPAAIEKLNIQQNRMAHASEIIDQIAQLKLRYLEVPVTITYHKSRIGQSNSGSVRILLDLILEKFEV